MCVKMFSLDFDGFMLSLLVCMVIRYTLAHERDMILADHVLKIRVNCFFYQNFNAIEIKSNDMKCELNDLFEFNTDALTTKQIDDCIAILKSDTGIRYEGMESNIVLKIEMEDTIVFLDMEITINIDGSITTRLHHKPGKINGYLHAESN
eukprot:23077_1